MIKKPLKQGELVYHPDRYTLDEDGNPRFTPFYVEFDRETCSTRIPCLFARNDPSKGMEAFSREELVLTVNQAVSIIRTN